MLPDTIVREIGEGEVTLLDSHNFEERVEQGVDGVVPLVHFDSEGHLYPLMSSLVPEVHLIGDALGYGPVHDAVLEGHRTGRSL